jgi:hypothetical protein
VTGEVTDWHDNRIRVITVVSYDKYQGERQAKGQPSDRQVTGRRQASDSRYKNNIKNNKEGKESKEKIEPEGSDSETENEPDWQAIWDSLPDATPGIEGAEE